MCAASRAGLGDATGSDVCEQTQCVSGLSVLGGGLWVGCGAVQLQSEEGLELLTAWLLRVGGAPFTFHTVFLLFEGGGGRVLAFIKCSQLSWLAAPAFQIRFTGTVCLASTGRLPKSTFQLGRGGSA